MARSRNIKPGFFQNEDLVELDFAIRLLFIGLWTIADREGRLENRPKKIKMVLFPADELDVSGALLMLAKKNLVTLYTVDNIDYIEIINFKKHQNPHQKEAESTIPSPMYEESTIQAPDNTDASPADSLNPITDSLNPITDSLNPITDSLKPITTCQKPKALDVPYKAIIDLYHEILPDNPRVSKISAGRKAQIKARWRNDLEDIDQWKKYFEWVSASKFLTGRCDPGKNRSTPFIASIDFLIKEANMMKIVEHKYHGE